MAGDRFLDGLVGTEVERPGLQMSEVVHCSGNLGVYEPLIIFLVDLALTGSHRYLLEDDSSPVEIFELPLGGRSTLEPDRCGAVVEPGFDNSLLQQKKQLPLDCTTVFQQLRGHMMAVGQYLHRLMYR